MSMFSSYLTTTSRPLQLMEKRVFCWTTRRRIHILVPVCSGFEGLRRLAVKTQRLSSGKRNETADNAVSLKSWRVLMINNDTELEATLDRIRQMQKQLALLRNVEKNPTNYRLSSSGFISEIDRMQLEVREYLSNPAQPISAG